VRWVCQGKEDEAPLPHLSEEHSMDQAIPVGAHFPYIASELPGRLEPKPVESQATGW
jgi:hypothetical protein